MADDAAVKAAWLEQKRRENQESQQRRREMIARDRVALDRKPAAISSDVSPSSTSTSGASAASRRRLDSARQRAQDRAQSAVFIKAIEALERAMGANPNEDDPCSLLLKAVALLPEGAAPADGRARDPASAPTSAPAGAPANVPANAPPSAPANAPTANAPAANAPAVNAPAANAPAVNAPVNASASAPTASAPASSAPTSAPTAAPYTVVESLPAEADDLGFGSLPVHVVKG